MLALVTPLACGDDDADPGDGATGDGSGAAPMSIADAATAGDGTEVTVTGFLLRDNDQPLVLSELLAESYPPQAGGATIEVADPSIEELADQAGVTPSETGGVAWLDRPITLTGVVEAGRLTGATPADG